jgi:hypothetical protein
MFSFNTIGKESRTSSSWKGGGWGKKGSGGQGGEMAQTMYAYMNK